MKNIAVAVNHRFTFAHNFKNFVVFFVLFSLSVNNFSLNSLEKFISAESFDIAQNSIARMINAVNLPFKMVEGHFKNNGVEQGSKPEKTKREAAKASEFSLIPNITLKLPSAKQINSADGNLIITGYSLNAGILNFIESTVHRRSCMEFMLYITMLICLCVLPRGISPDNVITKNINSLSLTAVFLIKHSFFLFFSGSKEVII